MGEGKSTSGAMSLAIERGVKPRHIDLSLVLPQLPPEVQQANEGVLQSQICQQTTDLYTLMSKDVDQLIQVGRGDGKGPNDERHGSYTYRQVYYTETGQIVSPAQADRYEKWHSKNAYGHHVDLGPVPMDEERVFDVVMRAYDTNPNKPAWITGGEYALENPLKEAEVPVTYLDHDANKVFKKRQKGSEEVPLTKAELQTTLRRVMGAKAVLQTKQPPQP